MSIEKRSEVGTLRFCSSLTRQDQFVQWESCVNAARAPRHCTEGGILVKPAH